MTSGRDFWRRLTRKKITVVCIIIFTTIVLSVIFADFIAPYGPDEQVLSEAKQAPSWKHIFGTDNLGRDIFSRILWGGRESLQIGIFVSITTTFVGAVIGCVSGYFGGKTDNLIMRVLDVFMAMPPMLLAIAIAASLGKGMINTLVAVFISGIPMKARMARGPVLALRDLEFIEAAKAVKSSTTKIIFRHIIPNIMAPLIVSTTLSLSGAIIQVAGLSFLGLGVEPPNPEWGAMLSAGRNFLSYYPWMVIWPGVIMLLTLYSINIIGDGLRDALDPRLKN